MYRTTRDSDPGSLSLGNAGHAQLKGRKALRRDLDQCAQANCMRFYNARLGPSTGWGQGSWRVARQKRGAVWSTVAENELDMPRWARGQWHMVCTSHSMASRTRTVTVPLCWALLRQQLKFWVQFWAPHLKKDTEVQWRRAGELGKDLEHKCDEEQLKELGELGLE